MDCDRGNKKILSASQSEDNEAEYPLDILWALKWNLTSETLGSRIILPKAGGGSGGPAEVLYPLAVRSPLPEIWSNKAALCNSRNIMKNKFRSTW